MRTQFVLALIVFALSAFFTQKLSAAQVLVVSSNGKWDMEYEDYGNVNALAAKALAACKAKGGTDPKIVWSVVSNVRGANTRMAYGAIAISDNGTGNIVGWSFNNPYHNGKRAIEDCRRKGGQNPKVVAKF
jgi:hypothetical protein